MDKKIKEGVYKESTELLCIMVIRYMHAYVFIEQYYDSGLFHNKEIERVWEKMVRMDITGGV